MFCATLVRINKRQRLKHFSSWAVTRLCSLAQAARSPPPPLFFFLLFISFSIPNKLHVVSYLAPVLIGRSSGAQGTSLPINSEVVQWQYSRVYLGYNIYKTRILVRVVGAHI